jgi:hypothetical protein
MVEYSLAKAEVEGSSPFFRLKCMPGRWGGSLALRWVRWAWRYRPKAGAHIIRITNDGKRYGESLVRRRCSQRLRKIDLVPFDG